MKRRDMFKRLLGLAGVAVVAPVPSFAAGGGVNASSLVSDGGPGIFINYPVVNSKAIDEMSSNRLVLDGLAELRAALQRLPEELRQEGAAIIDNAAEVTASSLRQSYPVGDTGNLRAGVSVKTEHTPYGTIGIVTSRSPHAHLWEFGSQNRVTRAGWRRGKSPEHKKEGLVPIAQRNRKKMNQQLVELVRKAGFQVSGDF